MPLKPEIKEKWCQALESGEYKQSQGHLGVNDHYCCLGVLAKVMGHLVEKPNELYYVLGHSSRHVGSLPAELADGWGLNSNNQRQCIGWNDDRKKTFKEIAALIRERL